MINKPTVINSPGHRPMACQTHRSLFPLFLSLLYLIIQHPNGISNNANGISNLSKFPVSRPNGISNTSKINWRIRQNGLAHSPKWTSACMIHHACVYIYSSGREAFAAWARARPPWVKQSKSSRETK